MKSIKAASFALLLLISAIFFNSLYIKNITSALSKELDSISTGEGGEYEKLAEKFRRHERYISLTVSHDDLTNIEEGFAELIGAEFAGDDLRIVTLKSRLKDSLEHLGRLSGINIDSIL